MQNSLFTHPTYTLTFLLVFAVWAIPDTYETVTRRAKGDALRVADGGSLWLFRVALALSILTAGLLAHFHPAGALPGHRPWLFALGAGCVLAGLLLRRWAIAVLGRYFTVDVALHPDQTVIDAPPYRRIRHPCYSGSILSLLGVGLMLGHGLGLALLVLTLVVTFSYRVRLEERALLAALGEPYADYMRHTKRFIPFVW
ncbi:isoprenylcysteine carboxylmethyltransferase family protein [Promineifilum sp.]|uniref:methyltransferase family protein n=1 Tax=Promineifilum sp. TaxID=2664178 RepID=UPI0035B2BAFF